MQQNASVHQLGHIWVRGCSVTTHVKHFDLYLVSPSKQDIQLSYRTENRTCPIYDHPLSQIPICLKTGQKKLEYLIQHCTLAFFLKTRHPDVQFLNIFGSRTSDFWTFSVQNKSFHTHTVIPSYRWVIYWFKKLTL